MGKIKDQTNYIVFSEYIGNWGGIAFAHDEYDFDKQTTKGSISIHFMKFFIRNMEDWRSNENKIVLAYSLPTCRSVIHSIHGDRRRRTRS